VFFDRFYREVVGLQGDDIMDILDASFPWVAETFVGPFGLLAYQATRSAGTVRTLETELAARLILWLVSSHALNFISSVSPLLVFSHLRHLRIFWPDESQSAYVCSSFSVWGLYSLSTWVGSD